MTISSTDSCSFLSAFFSASNLNEKGCCVGSVNVCECSIQDIPFKTYSNHFPHESPTKDGNAWILSQKQKWWSRKVLRKRCMSIMKWSLGFQHRSFGITYQLGNLHLLGKFRLSKRFHRGLYDTDPLQPYRTPSTEPSVLFAILRGD